MNENPHAGQGSVLLDIGGDVGALVVPCRRRWSGWRSRSRPWEAVTSTTTGTARARARHHGHGHRPHVAVVDRPVTDGHLPSLVFPDLVEGSYELFDKGQDTVLLTAEIIGGQVTFLEWPTG